MSETKPAEAPPAASAPKKTLYLGPPKRGAAKPTTPTATATTTASPAVGPASTDRTTSAFDPAVSSYEGKNVPAQQKYSRSYLMGYSKTANNPDSDAMFAMKSSGVWTDSQDLSQLSGAFSAFASGSSSGNSFKQDQQRYPNKGFPNKRGGGGFGQHGGMQRPPRQGSPSKSGSSTNKLRPVRTKNEEEIFFAQIQSLLNKLTEDKFEVITEKLIALFLEIDDATTLRRSIEAIHKKALLEPHFAQMYTKLCKALSEKAPKFESDQMTFLKVLRETCQVVFSEKLPDPDTTDEEVQAKSKKRSLGNIVFLGELFKGKLMAHATVQRCVDALIAEISSALPSLEKTPKGQFVVEVNCERLCKLLSTTGADLDVFAKQQMDKNIETMKDFAINKFLTWRVKFLIRDVVDMRLNNWMPRRKVEGPKTIEAVHAEAELAQAVEQMEIPVPAQQPQLKFIPSSEYEKRAQLQEEKLNNQPE